MENEIQLESNIKCKVCGEQKFCLREGYYYCDECGTKQDQVRDIEVEIDGNETNKFLKKQKIKILKSENKPELTSWEIYNYILRGLVDELISFGAKDELKLMTLQIWAAYLRRMEVAFFNTKHAELPRLGVRFLKRDAGVLYNHCKEKRNKRKRVRNDDSMSGNSSGRDWRKSKRKLDESSYSQHTASQSSLSLGSDLTLTSSSQSGTTSRAIQLKYSSHARKLLKKTIPVKHIEKHEKDAEGVLTCHDMRLSDIKTKTMSITTLKMKHLYCILAIALNLVEDDIQMSDIVRFIAEDHISTKNLIQYFPENIVPNLKSLLRDICLDNYVNKFTFKTMRTYTHILAKFIKIRQFKKPDIFKLCLRYISDLNLPQDIADYVERLINLLPPQMKTRNDHTYPAFEARAMAYIIFVLKLLFGLDGQKEQIISKSAQEINEVIKNIKNKSNNVHLQHHAQLFVWSNWVEYIEMRKTIISQYNSTFSKQLKQSQSTAHFIEELSKIDHEKNAQTATERKQLPTKITNMQRIFENFHQSFDDGQPRTKIDAIKFSPSLTPMHSSFKRILLYSSNFASEEESGKPHVNIPEFMRVDHTQFTLQPFVHSKLLGDYLNTANYELKVIPNACIANRCYVGIFKTYVHNKRNTFVQADFNISEEEWLKNCGQHSQLENLEFKTTLEKYKTPNLVNRMNKRKQYENVCESELLKGLTEENCYDNALNTSTKLLSTQFINSIDVFSECHMEPIPHFNLTAPRRNLNKINLFHDLDDAPEQQHERDDKDNKQKELVTLLTSNMDCWLLLGNVRRLTERQLDQLANKFSRTFNWLLETCAQTIGIEWSAVYEQLLIIEVMFLYGIDHLDNFEECIKYKYNNPIKDINELINHLRELW